MSWIIEKKTKKYGVLIPKSNHWTQDDNKFGKKLMEKMGWSDGKGLGANESGNLESVALKVKNDTIGLGCSKQSADQWIAHQDDFNALLATLHTSNTGGSAPVSAANSDTEDKVQSLEEKSKSTRKRVHYKKFARGKDLSLGKGEDLDCIFGRRKRKAVDEEQAASEPSKEPSPVASDDEQTTELREVKSELSVQAYFAQKMAALRAKQSKGHLPEISNDRSSTSSEAEDLDSEPKVTFSIASEDIRSEENVLKKKHKKSKKKKNANIDKDDAMDEPMVKKIKSSNSEEQLVNASKDEDVIEAKPKKEKKKKKQKQEDPESNELQTSATELNASESKDKTKKKKKKDKK